MIPAQEKTYLKVLGAIIFLIIAEIFFFFEKKDLLGLDLILFKTISIVFLVIFFLSRMVLLLFNFDYKKYFYFNRVTEITIFLSFCILFDSNDWMYFTLFLPIIMTGLTFGRKEAIKIIIYTLIINVIAITMYMISSISIDYQEMSNISSEYILKLISSEIKNIYNSIIYILIYYILILLMTILFVKKEDEVDKILKNEENVIDEYKINDSNTLGTSGYSDIDIEGSYRKLLNNSEKLEDSNKILSDTNAELYTVQQIVKIVNSIMSMRDLCYNVNDIILGIMGASFSSVVFYDKTKDKLKLVATTITDKNEKIIMNDNINCKKLHELLNKSETEYFNFAETNEFPFVKDRNVASIMVVPLVRDSKKVGILLIEHSLKDYFENEKKSFMEVVGGQILIAFEKLDMYNRMQELALLDGLTGIFNRAYFQKRLSDEIVNAKKLDVQTSLVILDIDRFKGYNDKYGHIFGDKVLKHTVDVIQSMLRKGDVLARFGGEEFVIIFPTTGIDETKKRIESIREKLESSTLSDGNISVNVTASFGIASYPVSAESVDELIRAADMALYSAKNDGRNCVRVFQN